jgi:hypothetical protein
MKKIESLSTYIARLHAAAPGERVSGRVAHPFAGKKVIGGGLPEKIAPDSILLVDYGRADKSHLRTESTPLVPHYLRVAEEN